MVWVGDGRWGELEGSVFCAWREKKNSVGGAAGRKSGRGMMGEGMVGKGR